MEESTKITIACPECDSPMEVPEDADIGTMIDCKTCGATSEIISMTPLELVPLEEEK